MALLVLLALPATGRAQQPIPDAAVREGVLSFDGRATAGDFVGTTTSVTGGMTGGSDLTQVRGWVEAPVRSLTTNNGKRDKDLNKSMESDKFPNLRFDLWGVSGGDAGSDSTGVTLEGQLNIHGVTREVALPATVYVGQGALRVRTDFPLNLKDYQIRGLSKFLGLFKMYPDIVVHVDVTFAPEGGE